MLSTRCLWKMFKDNRKSFKIHSSTWIVMWTNFHTFPYILQSNPSKWALLVTKMHCPIHGTIMRTGITCMKTSCYMWDSACRWFIVKKAKIFWSYVKHFWILAGVKKCRIVWSMQISFIELPNHIIWLT